MEPRDNRGSLGALEPAPWGILSVLLAIFLAIALFVIILLGAAVIVNVAGLAEQSTQALAVELGATLVFEAGLLVFALALALSRRGMSIGRYGFRSFPLRDLYLPVLGIAGTYLILAIYVGLISALHLHRFIPTSNLPQGLFKARSLIPLAAFEACLVAPIVEESFFRGFVFRGLLGQSVRFGPVGHSLHLRIGFGAAALLSGFLFALAHMELGLLIPFTAVGMLFAWIFRRTGSLWPNILTHAGFNAVSLVLAIASHR